MFSVLSLTEVCQLANTLKHAQYAWFENIIIAEKLVATLRGSRPGVQSASVIMTS